MRDILILIMIVISILLTSLFFVGTNVSALGVNIFTNDIKSYSSGINFKIPLITNVIYVNLLKRNDSVEINTLESNVKIQNEYMLIWHVSNPKIYYEKFIPRKQQLLFEYISLYQDQKNIHEFFKNNGIVVDKVFLVNRNIVN